MNWKAFFIVLSFLLAAVLGGKAASEFIDRNYNIYTYVIAFIAIISSSVCAGLLMDSMLKFSRG